MGQKASSPALKKGWSRDGRSGESAPRRGNEQLVHV